MKRLRLHICVDADMPQAAAELLRLIATQVDNKIFPSDLGWGSLLGYRFEVEADLDEFGTAKSIVKIREREPIEVFHTYEFIEGDETLPWWDDYRVVAISLSANHKVTEISSKPGVDMWFMFTWGDNHAMGKVTMFATDGDSWVPLLDNSYRASAAPNIPEVTYDMAKDRYLTTGDQAVMKDRITKYIDKNFY